MNRSLTIEVIDQNAVVLLEGMEHLKLIKVFRDAPKKISWAKKYKGAMSRQPVEEIKQQLNELRNAWE
ncbi:MAG: hypothetical protein LBK18_07775 [Prevotellaceae bacterium]|jgi:ribosomal protein L14E/L6E/L27E|nr:hypothetical protein [Prevotellaceae bacterium]